MYIFFYVKIYVIKTKTIRISKIRSDCVQALILLL